MARIETRRLDHVEVVTISNQTRRNAFTHAMTQRLGECLTAAEEDDAVRCIVLTGDGEAAFSSGHDLEEMLADRAAASDPDLNAPFVMPRTMATPVIAAVNGYAYAAGLILALSCDIRVCDATARFAAPGARIGLLPIGGQISHLPAIMPVGAVFELLATSRPMDAESAFRLGLVNRIAEAGGALSAALEIAAAISANSPAVVRAIKGGLSTRLREGEAAAERFEWGTGRSLQSSPDADEGIRAFLEKRTPNFH